MGGSQNYGPLLDPYYNTAPIFLGYPKKDPNFDNHPYHRNVPTSLRIGVLRLRDGKLGLHRGAQGSGRE